MDVGTKVAYVGSSWLGSGLQERYPVGAVVIDHCTDGCPVIQWPAGGRMIVGDWEKTLRVIVDDLEETWALPAARECVHTEFVWFIETDGYRHCGGCGRLLEEVR